MTPPCTPAAARPRTGYQLVFRPAARPAGLPCWMALPDRVAPRQAALVAVHGIGRGAAQQAALFAPRATSLGRIVIAPLFEAPTWPRYQRLAGGAASALDRLLDELSIELAAPLGRVDLFGFSGGAQFAHRYAMLQPGRIRRLCVASAGWYTFPDNAPYPYGLGLPAQGSGARTAALRAGLDDFLRLPIHVYVGERDKHRDANTRRGEGVDRQQGRHRRARASRWTEALAIEAAVRGIASQVRFSVLPNCGHDFKHCVHNGGLVDHVLDECPAPLGPLPGEAWARPPQRPSNGSCTSYRGNAAQRHP